MGCAGGWKTEREHRQPDCRCGAPCHSSAACSILPLNVERALRLVGVLPAGRPSTDNDEDLRGGPPVQRRARVSPVMFDLAFNDRLDHLPELGQLIQTRAHAIMELWEELIERHLPASKRTAYRCELRDHLPQFLQKLGRDLVAGRDGSNAAAKPAAREHGLQRWQQGWELELVIRDYQIMYHTILIVARKTLGRELSSVETQNLAKVLQEASLEAVRAYVSYRGVGEPIRALRPSLLKC